MKAGEIFLLFMALIFSTTVQADEKKIDLQDQIASLKIVVKMVVSELNDFRLQHQELEHKYHHLLDELHLRGFNHIHTTKGVRTDEPSNEAVHHKHVHRRSIIPLSEEAGQKGEKGDRGPKGDAGLPGFNGDDGIDGKKGEKGDHGRKGDAGMPGFNGDDGIDGSKGEKGEPGTSGIQGPKGDTGEAGPEGLKGETGDIGQAGMKGNEGQKGVKGAPGRDGQKGDSGNPGLDGVKGANGTQGPIGFTGLKGQKGLKGDTCQTNTRFAFYSRTEHAIDVMSGEKIAFPNIDVNIGFSYERSGIFTCKVTGIYVFTWSIEVNAGHNLTTLIQVNGMTRGRLNVQSSGTDWSIGSTTIVLLLRVTDHVYISPESFSPGTSIGRSSSFSGFFLHPV